MSALKKNQWARFFKSLLRILLIIVPVGAFVAVLMFLFTTSEKIDDGLKLSLSALLGAMASYVFIKYSEFMKSVQQLENRHRGTLHSLDISLNLQLDWLSSVVFELNTHSRIVRLALDGGAISYDSSLSRPPVSIGNDVVNALNNITLKNLILMLKIDYERLDNDLASMRSSHRYIVDATISGNISHENYAANLPTHLEKIEYLKAFTEKLIVKTKGAIATVRVLKNDSRSPIGFIRKTLIEHKEPSKFEILKEEQLQILDEQISTVKSESKKET